MPERRLAPPRRRDDAGEVRELRQHLRRGVDELLRPIGLELSLQLADLDLLERLDDQQAVDEEPVALGRRNAAGRRVRARDEAHLLEVGHDVADRRRRQLEARLPRQHARADRLAVGDVALDQRLQQVLRARIQHAGYCTPAVRRLRPRLVGSSNRGHGGSGTAFRDHRAGRPPREPRDRRAAQRVSRRSWPRAATRWCSTRKRRNSRRCPASRPHRPAQLGRDAEARDRRRRRRNDALRRAALAPFDVPLIGINQGRLGFLTDIALADMETALAAMLDGATSRRRARCSRLR